jgi:hypothetical protein
MKTICHLSMIPALSTEALSKEYERVSNGVWESNARDRAVSERRQTYLTRLSGEFHKRMEASRKAEAKPETDAEVLMRNGFEPYLMLSGDGPVKIVTTDDGRVVGVIRPRVPPFD